jgi:hypothetical protein
VTELRLFRASGEKAGEGMTALLEKDNRCHRSEWKTSYNIDRETPRDLCRV